MYMEGPHSLYMSYVSPKQTEQDGHQQTHAPARDKGLQIRQVTKVEKSK